MIKPQKSQAVGLSKKDYHPATQTNAHPPIRQRPPNREAQTAKKADPFKGRHER
jgi:hypothetical protein